MFASRDNGTLRTLFNPDPSIVSTIPEVLYETNLQSLPLLHRGKVRDLYAVDDDHLLIVTTDRISAFDVIMPNAIPGKGALLTSVSLFWFDYLKDILPNQLSEMTLEQAVPDAAERAKIQGRAMVVKRLKALPIEAIVRGYLVGTGWKDYQNTGAVCGIALPPGLQQAQQLPQPIYTPSSKAAVGEHDENIDFAATVKLIGEKRAAEIRDASIALYSKAATYARGRSILIADTKFEFGVDAYGKLTLIDEVLTPDSSRFWPASEYRMGENPPSFDKQFVRDWLESQAWNKTPPAPTLPDEVVQRTLEKYQEAQRLLTA